MAYSIINPWRYGIGSDNVAKALGYNYQNQDPTETGKWNQWTQNNEGAWGYYGVQGGGNEGNEGRDNLPSFSDAFDPVEAQRQNDFIAKFVPALQKGRSDIWNAYLGGYGNEQEAIKNLYIDLGEYGGGGNVLTKEVGGNVNSPEFYDPTNRRLSKFLGGPVDLFKKAASDPKHFGIVGGPGYLPYSWDEVASDPSSKLASLGLFLDNQGKPIIGGIRSTPNNDTALDKFATMMPITLGSVFMGSALGGAFPGIDVGTGAAMEAGTTGLSLSNALGLKDLPSWLSSGIDKLGSNALTQAVQGKNPFDNPLSLATPFLNGLNLTGGIGESISNFPSEIDTFNTAASSWIDRLSGEGNMSFFEDLLGGGYPDWLDSVNTDNILDIGAGAGSGSDILDLWNSTGGSTNDILGGLWGSGGINLGDIGSLGWDNTLNPNNLIDSATGGSQNWLQRLLSGGSGSGSSILRSLTGSTGERGLLDYLGSLAPIGAFTAYAMNQSPFDTSRQESLWAKYNPDAVTMPYDLETGRGREALNSNLTRRGVAGSSFGNFDLASFDTLRSLGRQDLINRGALSSLGIANSITEAEARSQEQKNRLLGAALNAAGMAMSPRGAVSTYNPWGLA